MTLTIKKLTIASFFAVFVAGGGSCGLSMCLWAGMQGGVPMRGGSTLTKSQQANTEKTQQPTNSHCFGSNNASTCDDSGLAGVLKHGRGKAGMQW